MMLEALVVDMRNCGREYDEDKRGSRRGSSRNISTRNNAHARWHARV